MNAKSLVGYYHVLRNRYLEQLAMLPWQDVVKDRRASFDSMRNILLHIINGEDRTINYIIPGLAKEWVSHSPEDFQDMGSIKKREQEVESRTDAYLAKMTPDELERLVEYPMWGKPPVPVRVEDILIHMVLEGIHHFGELIALLWQIDVEPPHMGWVSYVLERNVRASSN